MTGTDPCHDEPVPCHTPFGAQDADLSPLSLSSLYMMGAKRVALLQYLRIVMGIIILAFAGMSVKKNGMTDVSMKMEWYA